LKEKKGDLFNPPAAFRHRKEKKGTLPSQYLKGGWIPILCAAAKKEKRDAFMTGYKGEKEPTLSLYRNVNKSEKRKEEKVGHQSVRRGGRKREVDLQRRIHS